MDFFRLTGYASVLHRKSLPSLLYALKDSSCGFLSLAASLVFARPPSLFLLC